MAIIYTALSYAGALSTGRFEPSSNGGIALAEIAAWYMGRKGIILLAFITLLACLKTSVGMTSAFASAMRDIYPTLNYTRVSFFTCLTACVLSNVGLDMIIAAGVPVLAIIYPLAIVLIIIAVAEAPLKRLLKVDNLHAVFVAATVAAGVAAVFDAIKSLPATFQALPPIRNAMTLGAILPFHDMGFGWFAPALVGVVLGVIIEKIKYHGSTRRKEYDKSISQN
jgi:LIVCS family branched-chain amino acid:cation transporter